MTMVGVYVYFYVIDAGVLGGSGEDICIPGCNVL